MDSPLNDTKSPHLYRQIEQHLRTRIESGELRPGDKIPSVNELREQFGGINHLTVRQALKILTDEGLVRAEQGRGTFVQQRARRVGRVALMLPNLEESLFLNIARGVQTVLGASNIKTLILDARGNRFEEADSFAHLEEMPVDGVIIFSVVAGDIAERICRFKSTNFPCVLVDRTLTDIEAPSVVVDNYQGGYEVANHLLSRGYTRIAWMGETISTTANTRLSGVRDGLNDAGIALPRHRISSLKLKGIIDSPKSHQVAVRAAVEEAVDTLLNQQLPPDAIACGNDMTALCVLEVLEARGVSVPQTVAVTGFDDMLASAHSRPPLTTIHQPMEQLGEESARLLLERITTPQAPIRQIVLPVTLIQRQST